MFVIVLSVVKVFDMMIVSVFLGLICLSMCVRLVLLMFDMKWVEILGVVMWCSVCMIIFGLRFELLMLMLIMWWICLFV